MSNFGEAAQHPSEFSGTRRWIIVGLLSVGMVIAYVSRTNLSVVLSIPEYIKLLHLSDTDRGMLNSAFFWAYALLQIPAGWVVDRYGVKFPYAISFILWCTASAGAAFTHSLTQLLILRVLLGAAESIVAPASFRWIRCHFVERERGLAVGLFMTGTKIGPALAVPLTAWMIVKYNWHLMFLVLGLGGILWLIPWLLLVQNDDREITGMLAREAADSPVTFSQIMANPITWGTVTATFCYMYFVYFCMTWMPAYFVEQRHLSLSKMGFYAFFSFGGMAIMAAVSGWAADRIIAGGSDPVTVRKWFILAGFAIASTELIGGQSSSVRVAVVFAVASLTGLGLTTANLWALTQTLVPATAIGRISGVQNCAAGIAGIAAPILTGWIKQQTGSYVGPMRAILGVLIVGALSYFILIRREYAFPKAAVDGAV